LKNTKKRKTETIIVKLKKNIENVRKNQKHEKSVGILGNQSKVQENSKNLRKSKNSSKTSEK
jgi:hypothetical protein